MNGQRPESNNFLDRRSQNFNGVDGGFVLKPPVDAITEFRILTHNAGAEFGQSLGSTTNIITRSGTNRFHGALWEFLRNDVFDATNYFAARTEPLKQNQFGATFGGPIRKDKTFFFAYFEGFRNRQGQTTSSTVPSVAERNGDFSALCPEGFTAGFCNNQDHQLFNVFLSSALSQQPVSRGYTDESDYAKSLAVHPVSQLGTQCVYHDPGGATGLKPGRRENRSLPHTV